MTVDTRGERDARGGAFEETMLPLLPGVFRLVMWLERDRSEAEEVVQETFFQALQSFHRFEIGTNARAWILTIMRHVRAKRRRAAHRLTLVDAEHLEALPATDVTPQRVTEGEVLAALARLPAGFQEVVLLCDVEDLSYREIATVLGIPVGTVMSRLYRARRSLRTMLADYAGARGIGQPKERKLRAVSDQEP